VETCSCTAFKFAERAVFYSLPFGKLLFGKLGQKKKALL
jgi:hypothetical protein